MPTVPFMPFYVADYMADTAHLTTQEHGAYLLLIFSYWQSKKPLRALNGRLASVARMSNEEWLSVRPALAEMFEDRDGLWIHKRVEMELAKLENKLKQAKMAGIASGEARRAKSNGRSTDVQRTYERNVNHTDGDGDGEVLVVTEPLSKPEVLTTDGTKEVLSVSVNGNGHSKKSRPSVFPDPRIEEMRDALFRYFGMDGQKKVKPPDDVIVSQCVAAIGDTPMIEVAVFLRDRYVNHEQSPRHDSGPRKYAWFVTVLTEKFGGRLQ